MHKAPQAVIDWVNEGRRILGLQPLDDLPKGIKTNPGHCPISNALKNVDYKVTASSEYAIFAGIWETAYVRINYPKTVRKWIAQFDEGKWSQYEYCQL